MKIRASKVFRSSMSKRVALASENQATSRLRRRRLRRGSVRCRRRRRCGDRAAAASPEQDQCEYRKGQQRRGAKGKREEL